MVNNTDTTLDVSSVSVGIIHAQFNEYITENLLEGSLESLKSEGVPDDNITVYPVPGGFEIPGTASQIIEKCQHDGIICLGAVIRGETPHFDYICGHVSRGIGELSMEADVPVIFGVLTTDNRNQALYRASSSSENKGAEAADALLQNIGLYRAI